MTDEEILKLMLEASKKEKERKQIEKFKQKEYKPVNTYADIEFEKDYSSGYELIKVVDVC